MDPHNEPEVKDVDRVEIAPSNDDETVEPETEVTEPESSQGNEGGSASDEESEDENKPDTIVSRRQTAPGASSEATPEAKDDVVLAPVAGETPRERALRLEVTRLKREGRHDRMKEVIPEAPPARPRELTDDDKKVLGKYKPEELNALKDVLPVLAKEMGFVRQDELGATTYQERAQEQLDGFLEKHPEYLPENDKDGTLWDAFKAEYSLFKQPGNPKDFQKIFERVHRDVFGIQPASGLNKVKAAREKVSAASHAGASSASRTPQQRSGASPQGLRLDMLKGFSAEEIADIQGGE